MNNLDIFISGNILNFLDNNEYTSLSEVCKKFNHTIHFLTLEIKFPTKKLIYSSVSYIEYVYDHHYTKFSYIHAITCNAKVDVLDWIYNNTELELNNKIFNIALTKGNINTLNWLREKKCLYNISLICNSINYKKNIIYWMHNNLFWKEQDLKYVIKNNDYDTLKWVLKSVPSIGYNLIDTISEIGNLNMLKWAYNLNYKLSTVSCSNASRNGHFKILKWLKKQHCPWDEWTLTDAIIGEHYHIIKWCLENGCKINEWSFIEARNKPDIYKLLLKFN